MVRLYGHSMDSCGRSSFCGGLRFRCHHLCYHRQLFPFQLSLHSEQTQVNCQRSDADVGGGGGLKKFQTCVNNDAVGFLAWKWFCGC